MESDMKDILEELERELADRVTQDDVEEHSDGVLLDAAVGLLDPGNVQVPEWAEHYQTRSQRRQFIIAAALLVAEIRRRDIVGDWGRDSPWVPVGDSQPKKGVTVLLCVIDGLGWLKGAGLLTDDGWRWVNGPIPGENPVVYWRPLP